MLVYFCGTLVYSHALLHGHRFRRYCLLRKGLGWNCFSFTIFVWVCEQWNDVDGSLCEGYGNSFTICGWVCEQWNNVNGSLSEGYGNFEFHFFQVLEFGVGRNEFNYVGIGAHGTNLLSLFSVRNGAVGFSSYSKPSKHAPSTFAVDFVNDCFDTST